MVQVIVETLFFFHPAIWWLSSRMRVEREHCCDLARWALARRPLLVGVVHGLEGSGTLTALVMANSSTLSAQIAYIAVFGLGSILGMTALSSCALWPMARFVRRPMTVTVLSCLSGVGSITYGLLSGSPILWRWMS